MNTRPGEDELSQTLRQLRAEAGLSGRQAADRVGFSQAKISRFESGLVVPTPEDAERLARAYHAPAHARRRVVSLATDMREETVSSRVVLNRGAARFQQRVGRIEAASRQVATFHPAMIPGLLQTPDYARAVFSSGGSLPPKQVDDAVEARIERQSLLAASGRRFTQIVTEGALRWHASSPLTMIGQLDHLVEVSRLPEVHVGVIWRSPASVFPMHGFDLYDRRAVLIGTMTATALLTDQRDVAEYTALFVELERLAIFEDQARQVLNEVADDYRRLL